MANYQIQQGDTLSQIASRSGRTIQELMAINPQITDPNRIYSGQTLNIPSTETPITPTTSTTQTTNQPINLNQFQTEDPIRKFNLAIWDMLRQAQGTAGNESLFSQQTALQRAAIGRQAEITPESLRVLSPSQQSAIRGGQISALEPEIDAVSAKIKAQDARLQNFESILGTVRQIGLDLVKITPSPEVLQGYVGMIEAGGSPTAVPEEIRDKVLPLIDWKKVQSEGQKQLTLYQQEQLEQRKITNFNSLADKYSKSPLIAAADRASTTASLIDTLEKDPSNRANQLIAIYQFIQILDNYQSAVREGEIGLLTGASSLQENLELALTKLNKGQAVNPKVVLDITKGLRTLVNSINDAASRKAKMFESQAKTGGIEDLWSNFTGGFTTPYNQSQTGGNIITKPDGTQWQQNADGSYTRIK